MSKPENPPDLALEPGGRPCTEGIDAEVPGGSNAAERPARKARRTGEVADGPGVSLRQPAWAGVPMWKMAMYGLLLATGLLVCAAALSGGWYYVTNGGVGYDAHAYWLAGRSAHPYQSSPGQRDAFLYSPVFALLMRPLALLPWHWFVAFWIVAESGAFLWLVAPLRWVWRIPVLVVCVPEVVMGNIYGFLGVAAVVGLRRPEAWAFPLLTKVTPGGVGLLWFAARGEWHKAGRVALATLVVSAVSYVASPDLWREWVAFLVQHGGDNGARVPVFLAISAVLTVVAARTDRAWLLCVAMLLAVPTFTGKNKDFALLAAAPRLRRAAPQRRSSMAGDRSDDC